jgi:hypothetical protein
MSVAFFRTPVSSTNKTDHHDITWILLNVALKVVGSEVAYAPQKPKEGTI